MSLGGLIAIRGSVAILRRPTKSVNTDLSANMAWATVIAALAIDLSITTRKAQEQVWGVEVRADAYGLVASGTDIKEQDGLQVQSGLFAGRSLKVTGVMDYKDSMGTDHLTVALAYAPSESFA